MKIQTIRPVFVDSIPDKIDEGVLYISERYKTAIHKCCCGCGEEVVTPLLPADWSVRRTGSAVSLHPSIGNWSCACRSHYWIRANRVVAAAAMSERQILTVKRRDKADKAAYIQHVNQQKTQVPRASTPHFSLTALWTAFIQWWRSLK